LRVSYTEEAIADIVDAIEYLKERSPRAAANLDQSISKCIAGLADRSFDGPISRLRSGSEVQSWAIPPFRLYYQRLSDELLIVRMYHQARLPITR
jgi:plasmid stabilization system protein ParE